MITLIGSDNENRLEKEETGVFRIQMLSDTGDMSSLERKTVQGRLPRVKAIVSGGTMVIQSGAYLTMLSPMKASSNALLLETGKLRREEKRADWAVDLVR